MNTLPSVPIISNESQNNSHTEAYLYYSNQLSPLIYGQQGGLTQLASYKLLSISTIINSYPPVFIIGKLRRVKTAFMQTLVYINYHQLSSSIYEQQGE